MSNKDILAAKVREIERICTIMNAPEWLLREFGTRKRVYKTEKLRVRVGGKPTLLAGMLVLHLNPYSTGARPYKGGVRIHKNVDEDLLTVLAMDMTKKNALALLPFGGAKAGLPFDPRLCSEEELRDIIEKFTIEMHTWGFPNPDEYVPGPDMNVTSKIMFWIYHKTAEANRFRHMANVAASVTGKPVDDDGMPGRENATSRGLLIQLKKFIELSSVKLSQERTMVIQGFGNVGGNIALLTRDPQFAHKVIAISDEFGGVYNKAGLDILKLQAWHKEHRTLKGFPESDNITNTELLELPTDILVPAAIENQIRKDNAGNIKAKVVYEGANEAISPDAFAVLHDRGIPTIPGIAANVGGVIVSYLEWRKNRGERSHAVDMKELEKWGISELTQIMHNIIERIYAKSEAMRISFADAAHILAMERIMEKLTQKHPYYSKNSG